MTVFDATCTHTGPSDHLSAVPEISLIDHLQIEPLRAAHTDAPRWLVGRELAMTMTLYIVQLYE